MERVAAISPGHFVDVGVVIAASRAGGTGIFDLGFANASQEVSAALDMIRSQAAPGKWGVRWDASHSGFETVSRFKAVLNGAAPVVVLAGACGQEAAALLRGLRDLAGFVALEVGDLPAARAAQDAGFDGVIVKGHEAGGRVGKSPSFILLQELRDALRIPYWIQGGVGMQTAAAAAQAGARGVVLCEQLWLTQEGPFGAPDAIGSWGHMDGGETILVGDEATIFRLSNRHGRERLKELGRAAAVGGNWRELLQSSLSADENPVIPLGQDIGFAGAFARRFGTTGRAVAAIRDILERRPDRQIAAKLFAENAELARMHGTRYPIVQGPMTRVSDVAGFARAVAAAGALPFLALSVMRGPQARTLLKEAKALLGDAPWGVGILGFAPLELRAEQIAALEETKPPFAIIAGGRTSQARELEALGISTYIHVPSPGLLQSFLKEGARKFIFEGSECGGHTGPRTSFTLWQFAVDILADAKIDDPRSVQVLFAGGVHDALSAAMVALIAAPLAARGMKVGVLMGTAYLFTREAVSAGAILQEFQNQAVDCEKTALLQSGVGVYTRCAETAFCDEFENTRQQLLREEKSEQETLLALELLNVGRLRIASKGLARVADDSGNARLADVDVETQRRTGIYMMGEVARLRREALAMADLHAQVSGGAVALLASRVSAPIEKAPKAEDIAIVGMACVMPGANDLRDFWRNIVESRCMFREVSESRWRPRDYFDAARAPDRIYSKWGAFLDEIIFDPAAYGIPPASLASIEPVQLLALHVATKALADAGLDRRPFPKDRTATIFASGAMNELGTLYLFRTLLSHYLPKVAGLPDDTRQHIISALHGELPAWTPDSFPGFLANVAAGRVSNRLDLRGANFTVDAACSSSLAAIDMGIRQLLDRDADVSLVGAIDGANGAMAFMSFAQTHALSPTGVCRPFSDSADGIVLGEGVAAMVLKRVSDAERDGDRIYAVVKGVGSSSDGRNRSLTAPDNRGQALALQRAYEKAGVSPASVTLIEAHGTGTVVGDKCEVKSMDQVFSEAGARPQSCAVGSVKSMIGHTKVTAGLAAMVKATLALKHRVLPPTLGVDKPSSRIDFEQTPFYLNTRPRPWFGAGEEPRRCGVSAFGFGGTNFHAVLEEYSGGYREADKESLAPRAAELFVVTRTDGADVERAAQQLLSALVHPQHLSLGQLAYSWHLEERRQRPSGDAPASRLAIVATSVEDLKSKLELFLKQGKGKKTLKAPQGVYYQDRHGYTPPGGVCMVFPGQGAQKVDMLIDLINARPEGHALFERADALLADALAQPLSQYVYPLPVYSDEDRKRRQEQLNDTRIAQPALGLADLTAYDILCDFGLRPDAVAGHSYGEYVALCVAGAISRDDLVRLSQARGRISAEAAAADDGAMAAVNADEARVAQAIRRLALNVEIANLNAPDQTIVAGAGAAIASAIEALKTEGFRAARLPVTAAFHCRAMADAQRRLAQELSAVDFAPPRLPVYSNTTAGRYPDDPDELKALLARHIAEPLRFVEEIERIYESGVRVFVETGPGLTLSGLIDRILAKRPHLTLAIDAPERPGWLQLAHLLAQACAAGLPIDVAQWFRHRGFAELSLKELLERASAQADPPASAWRVSGGKAEPCRPIVKTPATAKPRGVSQEIRLPPEASAGNGTGATITLPSRGEKAAHPPENGRDNVNDRDPSGESAITHSAHHDERRSQIQGELAQFIELQREQQVTMQRFIALQEKLLGGMEAGAPRPAVAPRLERPAPAAAYRRLDVAPEPGPQKLLTPSVPIPKLPEAALAVNGATSAPVAPVPRAEPPETLADQKGAGPIAADMPPTEQFRRDLLATVVASTGYSEDMLDPNANMEADLGIDSIKRIEIFNDLKDRFPFMEGQDEEVIFDQLASLKTLNAIIEWYDGLHQGRAGTGGPDQPKKAQAPSPPLSRETMESFDVQPAAARSLRHVLAARPAPREGTALEMNGFPYDRVILLVGAPTPLQDALKAALLARGNQLWRIIPAPATAMRPDNVWEIDFSDGAGLAEFAAWLRGAERQVGAIFNFAGFSADEADDWRRADHARTLFQLIKSFESDLEESVRRGGGWLVNVTALDGQFGLRQRRAFAASTAGSLGVAKCAAFERPTLRVRCLDIDPAIAPAVAAQDIMIEAGLRGSPIEIGLTPDGRWALDLAEKSGGAAVDLGALALDAGSVVLVTGGASGITADVAKAVAAAHRPRLILIGRSAEPAPEAEATRDLAPAELKDHLVRQMRRDNPKTKPVEIERAFRRMLKNREIAANIAAMKEAGAQVEYHSLDICNGEAFGRLIDDVFSRFGGIHGVIHGAGVLDDRLIRDKTLESFDRVFQTKVTPALVLAEKLRQESLRFLFFFSSIAGRFGNAGQSDYSAANEVLNKLAARLNMQWPGVHVVSINWGPWNGGMVTEELRRLYASRGIETLDVAEGRQYCLEELARGGTGNAEIVVAAGLSKIVRLAMRD